MTREEMIEEIMTVKGYNKDSVKLLRLYLSDADYNQYKEYADNVRKEIDSLLK